MYRSFPRQVLPSASSKPCSLCFDIWTALKPSSTEEVLNKTVSGVLSLCSIYLHHRYCQLWMIKSEVRAFLIPPLHSSHPGLEIRIQPTSTCFSITQEQKPKSDNWGRGVNVWSKGIRSRHLLKHNCYQ